MSCGLGKLQREILETLEDVRRTIRSGHGLRAGYARIAGYGFVPAEGMYELAQSLHFIAHWHGQLYGGACGSAYVRRTLQASFSRPIRFLLVRGHLKRVGLVPLHRVRTSPVVCVEGPVAADEAVSGPGGVNPLLEAWLGGRILQLADGTASVRPVGSPASSRGHRDPHRYVSERSEA